MGELLTGCWLSRQHIALVAFNLLLVYMLIEAHSQVKQSHQRLNYLQTFNIVHIQQPPMETDSNLRLFDGIPLKRHILNIDDTLPTTTTYGPTTPPDLSKPIDCAKLAKGDKFEKSRVQDIQYSAFDKVKILQPKDIIKRTNDCASFIKTMGYRSRPLSTEEKAYPIAFGMRMHWKLAMAERVLRAIYHPQNVYCIYIDKKSSQEVHQAMEGIARCFPNIFLANRTDIYMYGSYTAVWADLQCMRDMLQTGIPWTYYLNLAGQEYPLKTNLELVRMLKLLNGTNDIESYPLPKQFTHRVTYHHWFTNGIWTINYKVPKRPFTFANITLRKGCSYNTFSRPFVTWVLEDPLPVRFIEWSKDTDSPDELVWASLNALPEAPGGYPMFITQMAKTFLSREIVWQWGSGYCQGKLIRHICTFSFRDLPWLNRRWEIFANKFDLMFDHVVLDCIDEDLRQRERVNDPQQSLDWPRLRNLPHVLYRSSKADEGTG